MAVNFTQMMIQLRAIMYSENQYIGIGNRIAHKCKNCDNETLGEICTECEYNLLVDLKKD